jgi:hypothetical protein
MRKLQLGKDRGDNIAHPGRPCHTLPLDRGYVFIGEPCHCLFHLRHGVFKDLAVVGDKRGNRVIWCRQQVV